MEETNWSIPEDRYLEARSADSITDEAAKLGCEDNCRIDILESDLSVLSVDCLPQAHQTSEVTGPANFSITLCLSGKLGFEIDGGSRARVKPGTVIVFSSDRIVGGKNHVEPGEQVRLVSIMYNTDFLRRICGYQLARFSGEILIDHSVPESGAHMVSFPMNLALSKSAREIMNCDLAHDHARKLFLRAKAIEVLALVIDFSKRNHGPRMTLKASDRSKLEQARKLLELQYEQDWSIAQLAKTVGLNEKKLKTGFRQLVGKTVNQYHCSVRMEAAADLLESGMSVTETAMTIGFSSLSYFSKVFREKTGMLPSEYSRR